MCSHFTLTEPSLDLEMYSVPFSSMTCESRSPESRSLIFLTRSLGSERPVQFIFLHCWSIAFTSWPCIKPRIPPWAATALPHWANVDLNFWVPCQYYESILPVTKLWKVGEPCFSFYLLFYRKFIGNCNITWINRYIAPFTSWKWRKDILGFRKIILMPYCCFQFPVLCLRRFFLLSINFATKYYLP